MLRTRALSSLRRPPLRCPRSLARVLILLFNFFRGQLDGTYLHKPINISTSPFRSRRWRGRDGSCTSRKSLVRRRWAGSESCSRLSRPHKQSPRSSRSQSLFRITRTCRIAYRVRHSSRARTSRSRLRISPGTAASSVITAGRAHIAAQSHACAGLSPREVAAMTVR